MKWTMSAIDHDKDVSHLIEGVEEEHQVDADEDKEEEKLKLIHL